MGASATRSSVDVPLATIHFTAVERTPAASEMGSAVTRSELPADPLWPRTSEWFTAAVPAPAQQPACDLGLIGIPAFRSSITPTGAHATPAAVREALARYSTYAASHGIDIATLSAVDFGDVDEPDGAQGEARVASAVAQATAACQLLVAIGGDNSITYSAMRGAFSAGLEGCGLLTADAHHDLRDGVSNGSPVRRLLEAGLNGSRVVQIGIADFTNSAAYAKRAEEAGITVVTRAELRDVSLAAAVASALAIVGRDGGPIYVDLDVDVCDRAAVPGCPSAAPGGISADELREIANLCARDPRVRVIDITEIDSTIDSADQRTVRLAALLVLEAAAGLCIRRGGTSNPHQVDSSSTTEGHSET